MAEQTFSGRLMAAMAEMDNPSKSSTATVPTKTGGKYTYKYETLDQVLAIVRPALLAHGLALTQRQTWSEHTSSYALETVVFDDSEERVLDTRPLRDCPDAQQAGSWETYMRRYALRTAFGLTGEDDDGRATVKPKGAPMAAKRKAAASDMEAAKRELWAACERYAELHGTDARAVADGVKKRPDYAEDAAWLRSAASELESA